MSKIKFVLLCSVFIFLVSCQKNGSGLHVAQTVTVSKKNIISNNKTQFDGWGLSLDSWANGVGKNVKYVNSLTDALFSMDGLSFNIIRYKIAGGDNPSHNHFTNPDEKEEGWADYDEKSQTYKMKYDTSENNLNVLVSAYRKVDDGSLVEIYSKTPPYFMTHSGCTSGNYSATADNIKNNSYSDYASYLTDVTDYLQNQLNINIQTLSPLYEPNSKNFKVNGTSGEGCHVGNGDNQQLLLSEVKKSLQDKNLTGIKIAGVEESSPLQTYTSLQKLKMEGDLLVEKINVHCNNTEGSSLLTDFAKENSLDIWVCDSDGGGTYEASGGEMNCALWLGKKIISDITNLKASAWIMGNPIVNDSAKLMEGYKGILKPAENDEYVFTQKYYVLGHFTKFIRKGDSLISCDPLTLAAISSNSKILTIVCVNPDDVDKYTSFDFEGFKVRGKTAETFRTSGSSISGEHWSRIESRKLDNNTFVYPLRANSITTIVIQ